MAIKKFNSVAGFSVGDTQVTVIDANANVSASFVSATGNVSAANFTTTGGSGNITGANVIIATTMLASTIGNTASTLFGDGANITGIPTQASIIDLFSNGTYTGNFITIGGNISTGTGNVSGGNITTGGLVSATGNVSGGNLTTVGLVSATGNVSGGNITTGGEVAATGNVSGGNLTTGGVVAATGNVSGGNVTTGGNVVATGNVSGGNLSTAGFVSAQGNVAGGNLTTGGEVVATGNVAGGNLTTGGVVAATGNVSGGNLTTTGTVSATTVLATTIGNASSVLVGDGANISAITGANVTGTVANANYAAYAGNVTIAGQANITSVGTLTGLTVVGLTSLGPVGNVTITGGTSGQVLTTDGAGVLTFSTPVFYGNSNVAGFLASGTDTQDIITTANVQGAYVIGNGSALSSLTGANVTGAVAFATTANSVAGANVSGSLTGPSDISLTGDIVTTANVSGAYVLGNGSSLSSITGANVTGEVNFAAVANSVSGSNIAGNVTASVGNFFIGDGGYLSNVYANANVAAYLPTYTGNLDSLTGNVITTANVSAGNVLTSSVVAGGPLTLTATGIDSVVTLVPTGLGNVNVSGKTVSNMATPLLATDAATKAYVDGIANGLQLKAASNVATTGTIQATTGQTYVYNNGTAGVGATITFDNIGAVTIDAVVLAAGMRVLIKDEPLVNSIPAGTTPSAAYNGIYEVTVAGDGGNALVLTRTIDDDTPSEMYSAYTFILEGTVNKSSSFASTNTPTSPGDPIVVGTTYYVFVEFSHVTGYTGGNAILVTGTVIDSLYDGSTIGVNGSNQLYIPASAPLVTPNIGAATGTSLSVTNSLTANAITANANVFLGSTTITTSVTPTATVSTTVIFAGVADIGYELLIKGHDTISGDTLMAKVLTTPTSDYIVYGTVISGTAPGTFDVVAGGGGVVNVEVTPTSTNAMVWTVQAYGV